MIAIRSILALSLLVAFVSPAVARDDRPGRPIVDIKTARQLTKEDAVKRFDPKAGNIRYDSRMLRAAKIAEERARKHSQRRCWRYVKNALLAAEVVDTYPKTAYAKQAGEELSRNHGFRRLPIVDPMKAPIGSVLVYGGKGPGHVEIRTMAGFVSDFESPKPSKRPLIGVYVKPQG